MHETLDETIDRVAGEMSAVTGDPALTARVRERMGSRRHGWLILALAASVAGVVVIAMALWPRAERIGTPGAGHREVAAGIVAPVAPPREPVWHNDPAPSVVGRAATRLRGRASAPSEGGGTSVPPRVASAAAFEDAEAEITGPAPLAIAALAIPPLPGPDAVAIAPLDLAPLGVPELDTTYQSKELR
jgi:hypothetical protein